MKATTDRCLKAMRKMAKAGEPITSQALVDAVGIDDTPRSSALDVAAGWISTLRRYGFLKISKGQKVKGAQRQLQVYELTDWGIRYKSKQKAQEGLRIAANPEE